MDAIVLSHYQIKPILARWKTVDKGEEPTVRLSPDLGLSLIMVRLAPHGILFPDGALLSWEDAASIADNENNCFLLDQDGTPTKIMNFSEETNRVYSLMPTEGAPTMLISGIPMHRIKDTDPYQDTLEKIKTLGPLVGQVLDTATGLGYTAIEAAKSADQVTTIELDLSALEIARQNPWSRDLFNNPQIEQRIGDSANEIAAFEDARFDRILHDPPAFSLAGQLYSRTFYEELYRVLAPKGRLFHYVGNPDSPSGGNVTRGVIRRLGEAGFSQVKRRPEAFGLVASK